MLRLKAKCQPAHSQVDAIKASVERIKFDMDDAQLRAPLKARVQFRVAQPGELVAAGGRVLNLIDLSDVYMTFFLPETVAGKIAIGTEVRIVLDAAKNVVIPATVSLLPILHSSHQNRWKRKANVKTDVPC